MATEITADTRTEAEMLAQMEAETKSRRRYRKWEKTHPGVMKTAEDIAKIEGHRDADYRRSLEKFMKTVKPVVHVIDQSDYPPIQQEQPAWITEVEIVPILLPILDSPEHSEHEIGMLNLGLSVYNAGVRTRVLTLTDCYRVGFVKAFNGGMRRILSGNQWYTAENIKYTWKYVCLLSADICHEQKGWLKRLVEVADSDPSFGIISPGKKCGTEPQKYGKPGMPPGYEVTTHLTFDGGIIRREVLEQIGLLNEDYYHYAADYEFVHAAQEAGWKAVWVHDVWAEHDWTPDAIPEWVEHDRPLYYSRWGRNGKRLTDRDGKRKR